MQIESRSICLGERRHLTYHACNAILGLAKSPQRFLRIMGWGKRCRIKESLAKVAADVGVMLANSPIDRWIAGDVDVELRSSRSIIIDHG